MREQLREMIQKHGRTQQLYIVFEELAELIIAITKVERGVVDNNQNVIEEIADARIASEYAMIFYDITDAEVEEAIKKKLERLKTYKVLTRKVN